MNKQDFLAKMGELISTFETTNGSAVGVLVSIHKDTADVVGYSSHESFEWNEEEFVRSNRQA
jgi:hypothetical protein